MKTSTSRVLICCAALIWGAGGSSIKLVDTSAQLAIAIRMFGGGILFLFLLMHLRSLSAYRMRLQIPIAMFSSAATAAFSASVTMTEVSRAISLAFIYPAWTLMFRTLRHRRFPGVLEIALCLFCIGAVFLVTGVSPADLMQMNSGDLLALSCGFTWSLVMIGTEELKDSKASATSLLIGLGIGGLCSVPFVDMNEVATLSSIQWIWAAVLVVITPLPFLLYAKGQPAITSFEASKLLVLELPAGVLSGMVCFGEWPSISAWIGITILAVIAFASAFLSQREKALDS